MEKKMIAKALNDIEKKERISTKLVRMLESKIGTEIVRNIGFMPLDMLMKKYHITYLARAGGYDQQKNMLMHAVAKSGKGLELRCNRLIDYTKIGDKENAYEAARARFVANYQKNKYPIKLSKFEMKFLNKRDQWEVKKDKLGKKMISTEMVDGKERLLYDKQSGLPYYKYTPKKMHIGLAYKLHMLELHKMKKWDIKNPPPSERDLKQDLFPSMLISAYKTRRSIYNEHVRNILSEHYCGVKNKEKPLRLYETGSNGTVCWEQEADPYVYGYPLVDPKKDLRKKLEIAKQNCCGNATGLKIYDLFGNERMRVAA